MPAHARLQLVRGHLQQMAVMNNTNLSYHSHKLHRKRRSTVNVGLQPPCSSSSVPRPDHSLRPAHTGNSTQQPATLQDLSWQGQLRQGRLRRYCGPLQRLCSSHLRLQCQDHYVGPLLLSASIVTHMSNHGCPSLCWHDLYSRGMKLLLHLQWRLRWQDRTHTQSSVLRPC